MAIRDNLETMYLSAKELKGLTAESGAQWPDALVQDYLNILDNLVNTIRELEELADKIDDNSESILNHVGSESAHGVSGDNVGTENFCSTSTGGVVLLSELVANASSSATEITTTDISTSPAAYDQAYSQLQTDLINEIKATVNELVSGVNSSTAQINDIISKSKTAKQMSLS